MADAMLDGLWATEEGEADVADLVEELVARAHAVIDDKAVQKRSVPFAVRAVTADVLDVVRCYFLECDPGEPQLADATNWAPDAEPTPATIDSWSRGAVPLKRRTQVPAVPLGASGPGSSAGASRTPRSPRSMSRPKSREADAKPDVVVAKAPEQPKEPKKPTGPTLTPDELRAKRLAEEAREEAERLERLRAEVKGREYTYDAMGNVIVIEQVNPERLPPYQYVPRPSMAPEPQMSAQDKKKAARRASAAKGAAPGARFTKPGTYEELDSLQPPLSETITMREGVTLRQGESLTSGPVPTVNPNRMSRKDFETFVSTAAADQSSAPANAALGNPALPPTPLPPIPTETAALSPPGGLAATGGLDGSATGILAGDTANDVNLQLMAKDWGNNPPQKDFKPARKPRYAANPTKTIGLGPASLPRERGGTAVATHLPPPMLPATAGHGLEAYSTQKMGGMGMQTAGATDASPARPKGGSPMRMATGIDPSMLKSILG